LPQLRITDLHVARHCRDTDAGKPKIGHAPREFRHRHLGRMQRNAAEADEASRIVVHHACHAIIEDALEPKALGGGGPIGALVNQTR
jgi:hypothetical protein